MTTRLPLRKRFRKLMANSKGFSSVIGTTFMVLVMMFLGTSVFLWTLSQNTLYNEAVREKNQLEVDRLNERVKAFNANYAVEGNNVSVLVELQNQGPLFVHITNLWVMDVNIGIYNFSKSLSINYLQPGGNVILTANVTIIGSASGHRFSSWLITGRGNVVPLEEKEVTEEIITRANVTQGIGSISMDFESFRYFEYNSTSNFILKDYPSGSGSYNVPAQTNIAFGVNLTNFDPYNRTLTLNSHSLIWMYLPTQGKQVFWYIVNVQPNGTIEGTYTDISIRYGTTEFIVFASKSSGTFGGQNDQNKPGSVGPAAMNLLLLGLIGSRSYGQNIPFVSVYCS